MQENKTKNKSNEASIQDKINELKEFVFRPLEIKQTTYEKLEQIAKRINKTPTETNEGIINELYLGLKKSGDL